MARSGVRRRPGPGQAFVAALGAALVVLGIVGPVAAAQTWTVTASTFGVPLDKSTDVRLTITNTSSTGSAGIGCISVAIPDAYSLSGVAVVSVSGGLSWSATVADSPRGIVADAASSADKLVGDPDDDRLVLDVTVVGKTIGAFSWTAAAYESLGQSGGPPGCTGTAKTKTILMTIVGLPTLVPTDTPTPRPSPTSTPTPIPTLPPIPTSTPIVSLPPLPSPGLTPTPTPSPSTRPGSTPTPRPTPTTTAGPTQTPGGQGGGGSPGTGGTGAGGSGGPGSSPGPTRRRLDVPAADPGPSRPFDTGGVPGFGVFDWAVPGVILTGPGLLLIVLILAQAMGALAWLPVVRRKIGAFGLGRRHPPSGAT